MHRFAPTAHSDSPRAPVLLVLLMLLAIVQSKVFSSTITSQGFRRGEGWNYLGRMNLNPGKVTVKVDIDVKFYQTKEEEYNLEVVAIPGSIWHTELEHKCHISKYSPEALQLKKTKQLILPLSLTPSSNYHTVTSILSGLKQQTLYYFVFRDCSLSLMREGFGKRTKVEVELDVRNNQEHLAVNEEYCLWVVPVLAALELLVLLGLRKRGNKAEQEEKDEENWTKYLLRIALWIALGALGAKYLGHLIYFFSGHNYQFFQVVYLLLHASSDSMIIFLLILLSFGWTVAFLNHQDLNFYLPLGTVLSFIHVILTVLNKIIDDHDKYHMFDTIPAYVMLVFRLCSLIGLVYGVSRSLNLLKKEEKKMRRYFWHLGVLGTIYIGFLPVVWLGIECLEEEHREYMMVYGLEAGRIALFVWLAVLSGYKYSSYRKVLGHSFMEKQEKYY